jgi:cyclopropane-fatty-acyl-phospholipid synthase
MTQRRRDLATGARSALRAIAAGRLAALPLNLRFWDGSVLAAPGGVNAAPTLEVRDATAIAHLLYEPNQIGLARAWVSGALDVDGDLEAVVAARADLDGVSLSARERARLARHALALAGPAVLRRPPVPAIEALPPGRRHSLARDRTAVRHHYDVSNRFYRLILGPSMVYSCAHFDAADDTLEVAQERKLELICRDLRLAPGERLLDIGCGWGSLLLHAVRHHDVRAVGVTLSAAQAELARERVREAGLSDRVEVRVVDYREIGDGPFDKIASVGMYEHVGREQLDRYVGVVRRLLRPGGLFLNRGITRLSSEPPDGDTFISRYVFPDGELHPVTAVMDSMHAAGLEVRRVDSLREHYALTLRKWLANLDANRAEAIAEAGAERERVWRLYMTASALAFEAGEISNHQVVAERPSASSAATSPSGVWGSASMSGASPASRSAELVAGPIETTRGPAGAPAASRKKRTVDADVNVT